MAIFKCKMCGGDLEMNQGSTVAECVYCGTQQTLPKLDDDRKANLYDRANHFRRNNDFDKAMGIYEQILNTDTTDAEAYWSLVLCHYGIEYVEDPATHKRVPTVNRAQFTSIFDDANYKSALEYADVSQKQIYENEAKAINEIQKGILAISQNEEPFDVFICYKETDANGRRTPDSVLANDLYHQLTQEGFKVFFSRITLEDKLGTAYEPYIFAALNSSKVMVVLGTKPEYFNAVWVKNEWSRYLTLIKSGANKILIPAYKDMDPYNLPEEFSHLQAQDMSKLGFMQDLIRGIKKLTHADEPKTTVVKETVVTSANNTAPLLKRAFMFLEDGNWSSANEYCEKVLDLDPECADAYLGKLMADLKVKKQENLKNCSDPFDKNNNYQKAYRFGDDKLKSKLKSDIEYIKERNENARLEEIYNSGYAIYTSDTTESEYKRASSIFAQIPQYKDAKKLSKECLHKADVAQKNSIYADAKAKMTGDAVSNYELAIKLFGSISGWKDSDEQVIVCQTRISEIKEKEETERLEREQKAELVAKRNKKIGIIAAVLVSVIVGLIIVSVTIFIPNSKYNDAIALMNEQKYSKAIAAFEDLNGYKDSKNKITECNNAIIDNKYNDAVALIDDGNIVEAYEELIGLDGYKDSVDKANSIYDEYKVEKLKVAEAGDYVLFGSYEQDNNTSNGKEHIEWLVLEEKDNKVFVVSKYALDCRQYDSNYGIWADSSLRNWLNNDFVKAAFSDDEKAMIPTITVYADRTENYWETMSVTSQDKVFLLSVTEAKKYFSSDDARVCKASNYAIANGAYVEKGNCLWWLRTIGDAFGYSYAARVHSDGGIRETGNYVYLDDYAVRPAMWIELK